MVTVLQFLSAVVDVVLSFTFQGIPIFYVFLGCVALRLVLKAVIRTADGGVSGETESE